MRLYIFSVKILKNLFITNQDFWGAAKAHNETNYFQSVVKYGENYCSKSSAIIQTAKPNLPLTKELINYKGQYLWRHLPQSRQKGRLMQEKGSGECALGRK